MGRSLFGLALLALSATAALAEDVLTLTGETFAEAVKTHEKLIVEFYAPWCGHCKKLEPEFEAAAGQLKADGITLAKVDATEDGNKELASKFGVQGFPTLKIFRGDADAPGEYEGPRETDGIVAYSKKQFGPAFVEITTADEATAATTPSDDVSVVGTFPAGADSASAAAFKAAAEVLRNDATFAFTTDAKLVKEASGKEGIVLVRNFDDNVLTFDGKFEKADIVAFVEKGAVPRLTSLDRTAKNKKALAKVFADKQPKVLGCAPADFKDLKEFQEQLIALNEAHDDLHVIFMDPAENSGALSFFGATTDDLPAILIHDPKADGKFNSGVIEVSKMKGYVEDFKAGKIEKTVKSEDVPTDNDGPVTVVVGKNFEDVVMGKKNVLIEFYAPWCGHCKKLEPIYNELGEAYKGNDSIVIAKMDATANDIPVSGFDVKGFPTIMYVTAEGKIKPFEGGRELADFKKFIDAELGIETEAEAPKAAEEKKDEL